MYFGDDHKKSAMIIMGKRTPKGEKLMDKVPMKPEIVKTDDGEVDGRHVAAQDMLAAFHEKSPQKLMEAVSNFIDIHHSSKEPKSEE